MNCKSLAAVAIVIGVAIAMTMGAYRWLLIKPGAEALRGYSRVEWGMTIDEVREAMGRNEDPPDERMTMTGKFERSWTYEDGARCTVVFDRDGHSIYKEIAPSYCGVTPLMGEYVEELPEKPAP